MPAIEVENLGKYFGHIKAVDDISFSVEKGEVLGFLGPNGAGKSTTMRILSCFISPDFGSARINGYSILTQPVEVRKNIGYLPENAPSYDDMNVRSFLHFIADIRGISGKEKIKKIETAAELTQLTSVLTQSIGTLSKGYRRRVGVAQAIIHDPEILIMDEPTDGLDPNQKYEVRQLIKTMSKDKAIIISTHILEEVDEVCTRAIIIASGKIVADGTPLNLRKESSYRGMIELILSSQDAEKAGEVFPKMGEIQKMESQVFDENSTAIRLFPAQKDAPLLDLIMDTCRKNSWKILGLSVDQGRLSDVFRTITT
ncbi:MAG: ATP-binding cassette domain-containing protein [Candidatus Aureabacteria bacterium]|nr:ATP-binding cassette domain-containing protein [Candidatus Auribacterota bacterium]